MGNKEFKGVNPVIQLKDSLDGMSDDQYDNYKSQDTFEKWCQAHGFDVPDDRCAAEQLLDELNEDQAN